MGGKYKQKVPLPDGWIAKMSRSHPGNIYYVNKSAKISSWTLPELGPSGKLKVISSVPSKCPKVDKRNYDILVVDLTEQNDPSQKRFCSKGFKEVNDLKLDNIPNKQGSVVNSDKPHKTAFERKKLFKEKNKHLNPKIPFNKRCEMSQESFKRKTSSAAQSLKPNPVDKVKAQQSKQLCHSRMNCSIKKPITPNNLTDVNSSSTKSIVPNHMPKINCMAKKPTIVQQVRTLLPTIESSDCTTSKNIAPNHVPNMSCIKRKSFAPNHQSNLNCSKNSITPNHTLNKVSSQPTKNYNKVCKTSDNSLQKSSISTQNNCSDSSSLIKNNNNTTFSDICPTSISTEINILNNEVVEDIEMLDLSVDFKKIDELLVDDSSSYYVVLDTNIFIHELAQIEEIKDISIINSGFPHIVIPWIVIQELDGLRKIESSEIRRKAHEGIKYINRMIKGKHPRFHGQSPKEMKDGALPFSKCNDDFILECCLNLAEKMSQDKVILLSNDINLCTKAMIMNITAHDIKSFMIFAKDIRNEDIGEKICLESNTKKKYQVPMLITSKFPPDSVQKTSDEDSQIQEIHILMTGARCILKEVLSKLIKVEMDEAYGAVWKAFKIDMNSLKSIFKAIDKYWMCVFSFHFKQRDNSNFKFLQNVTDSVDGFLSKGEKCLEILSVIEKVFISIKKAWPELEVPLETIKNSHLTCVHLLEGKKTTKNENLTSLPQNETVFNVFQHNWATINHLCGIIMDFYGLPHGFVYERPSMIPSEKEFENLMCNLYPSVKLLCSYMSKVVRKNHSSPVLDIEFYRKFYNALNNFIPSLKIQASPVDVQHFNVQALFDFCCDPSKQEMLFLGYKQLEEFCNKLEEALASLVPQKRSIFSDKMICD